MSRRSLPAFAAIDFLSCLLVVFVAVALTSARPHVETPGAYAVTVSWARGDNDVDLYLRDPQGGISYFASAQVDQMQLEHDDLGTNASGYGRRATNTERTVIRAAAPGQYVANVHLYRRSHGTGPLPVTVELWDIRGVDHRAYTTTVRVTRQGDERTAFRFTLSPAGALAAISHLQVSLVRPSTRYS